MGVVKSLVLRISPERHGIVVTSAAPAVVTDSHAACVGGENKVLLKGIRLQSIDATHRNQLVFEYGALRIGKVKRHSKGRHPRISKFDSAGYLQAVLRPIVCIVQDQVFGIQATAVGTAFIQRQQPLRFNQLADVPCLNVQTSGYKNQRSWSVRGGDGHR